MSTARKREMVTFKADGALVAALADVPNRSEFIRAAILAALDNSCPLCSGTGRLTPDQRRHWDVFQGRHRIAKCERCHARHLVCGTAARPLVCAD